MGWTLDRSRNVWRCTSYSDLNYAEINNLAEYGQPYRPYERGYDHSFVPDFGRVVVEMPQMAVMTAGYGRNVGPESFPVARKFLDGGFGLPAGNYDFRTLVGRGHAVAGDRWIRSNLYGWGGYGVSAGSINAGDAAYIHGTVSLALMAGTRFVVDAQERRVDAEIGAGNDNWDFRSASIPRPVNAAVAAILGPDHDNLTAPIRLIFTGPGRRQTVRRAIRAGLFR